MKVAYIRLTDWSIALNGEHFNCDVWIGDKSVEITHKITEGQAGRMNKKDGSRANRPGDESYRFETEESAIRTAIEFCELNYPAVGLILIGNPAWADPMDVAWAADPAIKETLTILNDKYQGVDDCSGEYYDIIKRWDNCFTVNNLER